MAIGNFAFKTARSEAQSLVVEPPAERCELCNSDAAGATLCKPCWEMIRRLVVVHSKENQTRSRVATTGA